MIMKESDDAVWIFTMGMHLHVISKHFPAKLGKQHSAVLSACMPCSIMTTCDTGLAQVFCQCILTEQK